MTESWKRIDHVEAASFLVDLSAQEALHPFLGRECTVGEAARFLSWHPTKMLRAVRRLERLGLIQVTRVEQRQGRPIRHYHSVADTFFVPLRVVPLELVLGHANQLWSHRLFQGFQSLGVYDQLFPYGGFQVTVQQGQVNTILVNEPGRAWVPRDDLPAFGAWDVVVLTDQEAHELKRELVDLYQRYGRAGPGKKYILRVALAPHIEMKP